MIPLEGRHDMANINDYVLWMKDILFSAYPFGNEDAMVLCLLTYAILDDCFEDRKPKTLREVSAYAKEHGPLKVAIAGGDPAVEPLLHACGASRRYGNLILSDYKAVFEPVKAVQFSAMTFLDEEERTGFIAYRGTDGSIAGWKEDFRISYERIESQDLAVQYAENAIRNHREIERWRIGGHSKGGNLALYALSNVHEDAYAKIEYGWVLDGPGFCPQVLDQTRIEKVQRKLTSIEPVYSVVGRLFEAEIDDSFIVESSAKGIDQHGIASWVIEHGKLKKAEKHDPASMWINEALDTWLEDKPMEQRRQFVNEFFASFSRDPGDDFDAMAARGPSAFEEALIRFLDSSKTAKKTFLDLPFTAMFGKGRERRSLEDSFRWFMRDTGSIYKALILLGSGAVFLLVSENIMGILVMLAMTFLTLFELYLTMKHLRENKWDFEAEQTRITICIIFVVTTLVLLLKQNALFVLGSLIFGIAFLTAAYQQAAKAAVHRENKVWRILWIIEAVMLAVFGISYLIIPEWSVSAYAQSAGTFFIIDGVIRLAIAWHRK